METNVIYELCFMGGFIFGSILTYCWVNSAKWGEIKQHWRDSEKQKLHERSNNLFKLALEANLLGHTARSIKLNQEMNTLNNKIMTEYSDAFIQ